MTTLIKILRMFLWMTCLTGLLYPLLITGLAIFTNKSEGDFVVSKGKIVGAKLIGQKFEGDKYFWGRPSNIDYQPLQSTAVSSPKAHSKEEIPSELLFASGSGLDPHISTTAAYFQMERVAKARGMALENVKRLVDEMTIKPFLGFIGEKHLNVLLLNLKLDEI